MDRLTIFSFTHLSEYHKGRYEYQKAKEARYYNGQTKDYAHKYSVKSDSRPKTMHTNIL